MTLLQAILLGIVQGLTEFIPISSTAHLVIASRVMSLTLTPAQLTASIAVIQLGTLVAVLFYFAGDIWNISVAFARDHLALISGGTKSGAKLSHEALLGWLVIVGSIPVAVVGLLFKKQIEGTFTKNLWVIATLMSGIVGYASIWFLLRFLKTHTTGVFIGYRLIVGGAILIMLFSGRISGL